MRRSTRRLLMLIVSIPVMLLAFAVIYQQGMTHLEGETRTLGASIEWAAETVTATGYGRDNEWSHPFMQVFVVVVQFFGLFLVFLVFPIFLLPFFEERFEGRLPKILPELSDHVVVYRWGPAVTTLVDELDEAGIPVVVFEEDSATARRLHDRGRMVVVASLDDEPDLSTLVAARGVVTNGTDHANAVFTMSARQQGFDGPIVSMVASPNRRAAMSRAGATAVFTPKHALAAAIAAKASTKITPLVSGAPMLGDCIEVGEIRIDRESELIGKTLASAGIGAKTGATVIGQWVDGELLVATPQTKLERGKIFVAAGDQESMDKLSKLAKPVPIAAPFLICGYGETGRKVAQFLTDVGEEVTIIDIKPLEGVTHCGDALDPDLLVEAGAREAQAVILTLEHDSETVFASVVIRDLAPDAVIIAAADRSVNVPRIHRAGADFGFSIDDVAGQLMRFQLFGEESISLERQIKIVKTPAGALAGHRLRGSDVRAKTGCSIIAVERGGEVHTAWDEDFEVDQDDGVYVVGTHEDVARYKEIFG